MIVGAVLSRAAGGMGTQAAGGAVFQFSGEVVTSEGAAAAARLLETKAKGLFLNS